MQKSPRLSLMVEDEGEDNEGKRSQELGNNEPESDTLPNKENGMLELSLFSVPGFTTSNNEIIGNG